MKKKNTYVFTCAVIAALGGLLFGFDTAVISGAEKSIQEMFDLDGFWHGFTVAIALIGTIVGAMTAGKPADKYGRKNVLVVIALIYGLTALATAMANDWLVFISFRFIGGIGVGASSVIGPMYIAEIAPAHMRGRLVGMFQLNVVTGILLAFFSNYLISSMVEVDSWRWMLGVQAIPSFIFFLLLFYIPFTPRLLVLKGKSKEALLLLKKLASLNPEKELKEIEESMQEDNVSGSTNLFSKAYRFPVMLAILVAVFNQMSGINAIMYYAPRIFEMAGFGKDASLMQSVIVGATNFLFTMLAMTVIDRVGRKKLLLIGAVGMVFSLGMVAKSLFEGTEANMMVVIYLVGFIACFAFSQGAVIWVFISEIFPNRVRAKGQALGSFTHWVMAAIVSWMFPAIAESGVNGGGVAFLIFSGAMFIQLIVVFKFFPETKGKSLEQIQKDLKVA